MAAMSVIIRENELANYYHRKVEQGKSKMYVLNAATEARFATRLYIGYLPVYAIIKTGSPGDMKKTIKLLLLNP